MQYYEMTQVVQRTDATQCWHRYSI